MVATRNHPEPFKDPPITESPTKRVTRSSAVNNNNNNNHASPTKPTSFSPTSTPSLLSQLPSPRTRTNTTSSRPTGALWSHTPSNLTLIWLAVSLPLVIWDTGYVLLRPLSMPGGSLHSPIWSPYELYGRVDYMYGFPAWDARNGWTAAQGFVNALETAAYLGYLYVVYTYGQPDERQGRGAPDKSTLGRLRALGESRTLDGRLAAGAVVLAYSTALITFWKTVLYWLIEIFSGFESTGHNDWVTLTFLWIIPNGMWLIFPAYMIYVFGAEILEGLENATAGTKKSQ